MNTTPSTTDIAPSAACRDLLARSEAVAQSWSWPRPGGLSLLASCGESGTLEPLLDELTRGVLEPEEAALLLEGLRPRFQALHTSAPGLPPPEPDELAAVLEQARAIAIERQDPELRPLHVALALLANALELGPETLGVADFLLLRRLLLGPRLAGAPPAERRIASIDLDDYRIRSEVLDLLPPKLCRQHNVLPLKSTADTLYLASAEPERFHGREDISFWAGCKIELVRVTRASLDEAMNRHLPDETRAAEAREDALRPPAAQPESLDLEAAADVDAAAVPDSFGRLQKLIELDPHDRRYHASRGELYRRLHYLEEAAESYRRAVAICEERGEWPEAVAHLRKLREIQPADRAIYRGLARNFCAMQMREELIEAFATFADLSARANDFDAVLELYLELTGRTLMDPELHEFLEQTAVRSYASYRELISAFLTLLRFHLGERPSEDLYYLHVKLGLAYAQLGFNEEALVHYHKAVDECRPKAHGLWTVGARAVAEGDMDRAMDLFLLALDEPNLTLRDRLHIETDLALCCEKRGDLFRAYQLLTDIRKVEEGFGATEIAARRLRQMLQL
jgi:tetratricopeptide (TPR) repeat protein